MAKRPLFGQILHDETPAPLSILSAGDQELSEARGVLFRATVAESTVLRRDLRAAEARLSQRLADITTKRGVTVDGTRLTARGLRTMERAVDREVTAAFRGMQNTSRVHIDRAINRAVRAQSRVAADLGLPKLSKEQLSAIREDAFWQLTEEFLRNSGLSYYSRFANHQQFRANQLKQLLRQRYPDGNLVDALQRDFRNALVHNRPGTAIKGGTAFKQMRRLHVAEETRIANIVELATVKAYGGRYVYWRLNPAHIWYGGKEICEVHASRTDPSILEELERRGISSAGVSLEGLYRIDHYPAYPHPFCKCFPEPWYPKSKR